MIPDERRAYGWAACYWFIRSGVKCTSESIIHPLQLRIETFIPSFVSEAVCAHTDVYITLTVELSSKRFSIDNLNCEFVDLYNIIYARCDNNHSIITCVCLGPSIRTGTNSVRILRCTDVKWPTRGGDEFSIKLYPLSVSLSLSVSSKMTIDLLSPGTM